MEKFITPGYLKRYKLLQLATRNSDRNSAAQLATVSLCKIADTVWQYPCLAGVSVVIK